MFASHHVEFLVVGGYAVAFHGYPRFTEVLALYVRADQPNATRIMGALRAFGFGEVDLSTDDFEADDRVIQLGRAPNRIDKLTRLWGVEFSQAWMRRVPGTLDDVAVAFLSREDLISNKLATARPQDLADAAALQALGNTTEA